MIDKKHIYIVLIIFFSPNLFGQNKTEINPNGYNVFYGSDSSVISEGVMKNGKPEGYWKNYYNSGVIKSEGNRKDYELDSLWKFYNEEGKIILEINYKVGKKNGFRITHQGEEITKENFVDDIKQGNTYVLYANGKIRSKTPFINGLEDGIYREYNEDGDIIQLVTYKKGYVTDRSRINRYDLENMPNGKWLWFSDDELVILKEGSYKHGLKHGYFKEYDMDGNLISATKYIDGEIFEKAEELQKLDVRTDYYPSGVVKVVGTYTKDGVPEGVRREYNEKGNLEKSFIFKYGKIIGEGIFTDAGQKQGFWKEYYDDGILKAEGKYMDDKKNGYWKYFYKNGNLEERGKYILGNPDSTWFWYYSDGKLLRKEDFYNGLSDGLLTEFDKEGNIITQGDYIEGKKEGKWIYQVGDSRDEIDFVDDMRNGWYKSFYSDGELRYEGKFIDDNPNGEHSWYWDNGKLKKQGRYVMGRKNGDWKKFDNNSLPLIVISYTGGREVKYDGISISTEQ